MKHIEVVAAVIIKDEKFLALQRGPNKFPYIAHKWEFPGGKIEAGESHQQALIREIKEELHVTMNDLEFVTTITHKYPDFCITMHAYSGYIEEDEITLTEHIAQRWLTPSELPQLDWAAADIPIIDNLMGHV